MKNLPAQFLLTAATIVLTACGGGSGTEGAPPTVTQQPSASTLPFSTAMPSGDLITSAIPRKAEQLQSSAPSVNVDEFMTWVQQALPAAFPGPQSSLNAVANGVSYTYRYYPLGNGGWNILAVTADAKVYAIGDITKDALVQYGVLSDYLCGVNPGRCVASAYSSGSVEAKHFAELNDARIKGGFGALAQDVHLDTAAYNHAAYFEAQYYKPYYYTADNKVLPYTGVEPLNPAYVKPIIYFYDGAAASQIDHATNVMKAHVETPGQPGFTGILSVNRANAAGYASGTAQYAGEVIGFDNPTYGHDRGCVNQLLTTVFHRGAMLEPSMVDVGVGIKPSFDGYNGTALAKTWSFTTAPLVCDQFGCR